MEQSLTSVVHWYDTAAHRNACGAPGQTGSTKHEREVTCDRCRALLEAREHPGREAVDIPPAYAN